MLNVKVVSWSLGVWGGITFILCVLYGLLVPGSLSMHQALGQVLPGFTWLTVGGFVIGLGMEHHLRPVCRLAFLHNLQSAEQAVGRGYIRSR